MSDSKAQIRWLPEPEDRHVGAASEYLTLLAGAGDVDLLMSRFRVAKSVPYAAKDLFRASGLPLLPADDPHVARDLQAVRDGQPLSPVLAVRGNVRSGTALTIADGYHRLSACAHIDKNAAVMCQIVALDEDV